MNSLGSPGDHVEDGTDKGLRALLTEARWSGQWFARAVNAVGAEAGLTLRYGRASVAQWLSGARPREPAPALIVEALTRRLGRPVTSADTDYASPAGADRWWTENPVRQMMTLGAIAGGPDDDARFCVYSLEALAVPEGVQTVRPASARPPSPVRPVRVSASDVDEAGRMLRLFSAIDSAHGASTARPALAAYLAWTIGPWLRAAVTGEVRDDLFSVAAQLAYLCGFLCVDDRLNGLAQRYYVAALQLAVEAGDSFGYAIALRAMSLQAHTLGHHTHARDLAEAGHRAGITAPPSTRAFLDGQLAMACAAMGDRRNALIHLRAAERHFGRATAAVPVAVGAYHRASLEHQKAVVLDHLGESRRAIAALERSIRHRPTTERRSRAITLALLAELQFRQGQIEQATRTWHLFLDDYSAVGSRRVSVAFAGMRTQLRPHSAKPAIGALLRRAAAVNRVSQRMDGPRATDGLPSPAGPVSTASTTGVADALANLRQATATADRARASLVQALRAQHQEGTSANRLAAAANGVMSRPVVLRALRQS